MVETPVSVWGVQDRDRISILPSWLQTFSTAYGPATVRIFAHAGTSSDDVRAYEELLKEYIGWPVHIVGDHAGEEYTGYIVSTTSQIFPSTGGLYDYVDLIVADEPNTRRPGLTPHIQGGLGFGAQAFLITAPGRTDSDGYTQPTVDIPNDVSIRQIDSTSQASASILIQDAVINDTQRTPDEKQVILYAQEVVEGVVTFNGPQQPLQGSDVTLAERTFRLDRMRRLSPVQSAVRLVRKVE